MKKVFACLVLFLLTAAFLPAQNCCKNEYYISGFGAVNFKPTAKERSDGFKMRWHYDTGYFPAGAVGFRMGPYRMEGELGYRQNRLKKLNMDSFVIRMHKQVNTWSGMANFYYDFVLMQSLDLKVYAGAGLGYARAKDRSPGYQPKGFIEVKRGFAWQLIAGASCPVLERLDATLEYRYFQSTIDHESNHSVGGGLRYWF